MGNNVRFRVSAPLGFGTRVGPIYYLSAFFLFMLIISCRSEFPKLWHFRPFSPSYIFLNCLVSSTFFVFRSTYGKQCPLIQQRYNFLFRVKYFSQSFYDFYFCSVFFSALSYNRCPTIVLYTGLTQSHVRTRDIPLFLCQKKDFFVYKIQINKCFWQLNHHLKYIITKRRKKIIVILALIVGLISALLPSHVDIFKS